MGKVILLFDMDGTLTEPRKIITTEMRDFLASVRRRGVAVALVGGSDLAKITEQMDVCSRFDYVFSENGVVGYKGNQLLPGKTLLDFLGEKKLQTFINFCLKYIADIELPAKRGTFIEYRKSMLNVSPVGRACEQSVRDKFVQVDERQKIREIMVAALRRQFPVDEYGLQFAIGGQISVDVFPVGWDKSYCLQYLVADSFDNIHFFGDKTQPGGNDHEVFEDKRTAGHTVVGPADTQRQVLQLLEQLGIGPAKP